MLRNVDRNVVGFLLAIELYLLRGLDGARTSTLRNRSVDERAVLQGLQTWSSYIWSQTVDLDLFYTATPQ